MQSFTLLIIASLASCLHLVGADCDSRPCCKSQPGSTTSCCQGNCCDANCGLVPVGTLPQTLECEWRVVDQTITVNEPTLLVLPVGETCPLDPKGILHLWQCEDCAKLHKPCEGQYAACKGCCGTEWHNGMKVPVKHDCKSIKEFYKFNNAADVDCDSQVDKPVGMVKLETVPLSNLPNLSGKLDVKCSTDILKVECQRVPVKLKFECNQCNSGSPELLQKCCDKGLEFLESDAVESWRRGGYEPFIWLSGCDVPTVRAPEGFDPFPFPQYTKYANYTEVAIDANMEQWIEDEVCSLLDPSCDNPDAPTTAPAVPSTTSFAGCEADPVLFSSDEDTIWENQWDGWTELGDYSTTGKTICYDEMRLHGLRLQCTSPTKPWEAVVELERDYWGRTMQEIASSCISTTSSEDTEMWNYGQCPDVGSVYWEDCPGLDCGSKLRLGVAAYRRRARAPKKHPDDDWAMFMMKDGFGPDSFKGASNVPYIGGKGQTGSCDGTLSIIGLSATDMAPDPKRYSCGTGCPYSRRLANSDTDRRMDTLAEGDPQLSCPWLNVDDHSTIAPRQTTGAPNTAISQSLRSTASPEPVSWLNMVSFRVSGLAYVNSFSVDAVRQASASALSKVLEVPESRCNVSLRIESSTCELKVGIAVPESYAPFDNANDISELESGVGYELFSVHSNNLGNIEIILDEDVEEVEDLQETDPSCTTTPMVELPFDLQPVHGSTIITHFRFDDMSYDSLISAADTMDKLKLTVNTTMIAANLEIGTFYNIIVDFLPATEKTSSGGRLLASGEQSVVIESAMVQKNLAELGVSDAELEKFKNGFTSDIGSELTSAISNDNGISAVLKPGAKTLSDPNVKVFEATVGEKVAKISEARAQSISTPTLQPENQEDVTSSAMMSQIGTVVFLPIVLLLIHH